MPNSENTYFETNRKLWNSRVADHLKSDFYGVDNFRKGETSLNKIELEKLGDVKGKSLLHLQCHFGMDTLSWERLGATVTGVDLSDEAVAAAEKLRDEVGLKGKFVCCNVYDIDKYLHQKFDIIFTSYGTIGWLPDLDRWAKLISDFLKPGGTFFIADFHPVIWMFDEKIEQVKYSYFNHEVIATEAAGSYAARHEQPQKTEFGWNHNFAEIFSALMKHGMTITHFEEYPYSPYNCFQGLVQGEDKMWRVEKYEEKFPMVYSLSAKKV